MATIRTLQRRSLYQVQFAGILYEVTVARDIDVVKNWIEAIERVHAEKLIRNKLLVGIAVQWKTVARADLLQICVGRKVLIVMLRFFTSLPKSLDSFLNRKRGATFYGFSVKRYKTMLLRSHMRIKTKEINDFSVATPALIALSRSPVRLTNWRRRNLSPPQIEHASLRAIAPFHAALQNANA